MSERKTAEAREKDLRLAVVRIQRGRTKTKVEKLTFASVAREAGVSPALIHNCYPKIAEMIREAQGRSGNSRVEAKRQTIKAERERFRALRAELDVLQAKFALLASINEVLQIENRELRARLKEPHIVRSGRFARGVSNR